MNNHIFFSIILSCQSAMFKICQIVHSIFAFNHYIMLNLHTVLSKYHVSLTTRRVIFFHSWAVMLKYRINFLKCRAILSTTWHVIMSNWNVILSVCHGNFWACIIFLNWYTTSIMFKYRINCLKRHINFVKCMTCYYVKLSCYLVDILW